MSVRWSIAAAALCAAAELSAQAPTRRDAAPAAATGTAVIAGTVVAADSGRPVRLGRVTLSGGGVRMSYGVTTDDQGRFSFPALPAGEYTLAASKLGFLPVTFGQRQPGSGRAGTAIVLADGQRLDRIVLRMPRGGVITGTILDELGDPSYGAQVRALQSVHRDGRVMLLVTGAVTTDDRGIYRMPLLPPGDYIVSATPRQDHQIEQSREAEVRKRGQAVAAAARASGDTERAAELRKSLDAVAARSAAAEAAAPERITAYAPVYYPGTTMASAAMTITLGISEERTGIDLQLQLVPMSRISGTVVGEAITGGGSLFLIDAGQGVPTNARPMNREIHADGRFTFENIPPGNYTLFVYARTHWASMDLSVDGRGVNDVALHLQPGLSVSGSVVFDGPTPASFANLSVSLDPIGPLPVELPFSHPVKVDANGQFTIRGLVPGRYRVLSQAGKMMLTSALFGNREALDDLLEIKAGELTPRGQLTFSARTTEITGTLLSPSGHPASDHAVVVFADDDRYWTPHSRRIKATRPSSDGLFTFTNLPAGTYRVAAADDVEPVRMFDPAFLRSLVPRSTLLSMAAGEKKTQDVKVQR